ncbi:hypothetical protein AB4Z09_04525 [Rhodococcus sp. TAF43]|nr:hypothetical protein [Rhodococcus sp. W8901]
MADLAGDELAGFLIALVVRLREMLEHLAQDDVQSAGAGSSDDR